MFGSSILFTPFMIMDMGLIGIKISQMNMGFSYIVVLRVI
jgi:hypothetical protein